MPASGSASVGFRIPCSFPCRYCTLFIDRLVSERLFPLPLLCLFLLRLHIVPTTPAMCLPLVDFSLQTYKCTLSSAPMLQASCSHPAMIFACHGFEFSSVHEMKCRLTFKKASIQWPPTDAALCAHVKMGQQTGW